MRGTQRFRLRKRREGQLTGHVAVALEGIRKELDRYRTSEAVGLEGRESVVRTSGRVEKQG